MTAGPFGLRLLAPAKLNLGLEILARRADGYHEIETIFTPLRLYDRIEMRPAPGEGLCLDLGGADLPAGDENLIARAARRSCEALGLPADLCICLDKRIPVAAGLGGGSADAAVVILGIEALFERELDPRRRVELARGLGADVPFFLSPTPAIGRGAGELLEPIPDLPPMAWVLGVFPFPVSTPWAYAMASRQLTLPRQRPSIAALLGPTGVAQSPPNDLETAATQRHPEIGWARRALESAGAIITGMSGSGPTVYGRFASLEEARKVARELELPGGARALAVSSPPSGPANWDWGVAKW